MKQNIFTPPLRNIKITDKIFGKYAKMVAEKLIPYQWAVLNDQMEGTEKSYCVSNFRIAAGEAKGERIGMVFSDTDAYKWLETLAFCLENGEAKAFESVADEFIELIGRAQESDGYLNTYFTVLCPEKKWTNFTEGHELYTAGHLIEAAVAYYQATGKRRLLNIASKFADLIIEVFSPDGKLGRACPGHPEIELALVKLARVTGEKKYSDLALHFIDVRGTRPNFLIENLKATENERIFGDFADYDEKYAQSHLPVREQTTAEGHSVRAVYLFSAMADLAKEYNDDALKNACRTLWNDITQKRMYITGGIGSSGHLERFTADYDLPNDRMYCESCASVGLMMFGQRMAALTGEASYYEAVELALCNTVLAGIAAEGDKYFYVNPLEVWPDNCCESTSMSHVKPVRQPWFTCACCPSNIARTLASVGQYIYAQDEKSIYVNQFISSEFDTEIRNSQVSFTLNSFLPNNGKVSILICSERPQPFTLRIRIPKYLRNVRFTIDGCSISPATENGYAVLAISHSGRQELEISGTLEPQWIAANTGVRADIGKVALMFGPYVYCLEQTDNAENLAAVHVSPKAEISVSSPVPELPGNLPALCFHGKRLHSFSGNELYSSPDFTFSDETLTAVPYGLWCNRTPGEMTVWMKTLL